MALPDPGNPISTSMIYAEYYGSHTSQVVDISTMSNLYGVSNNEVEFADFYSLEVADACIWRWWDLDGNSNLGQDQGTTLTVQENEFIIDPSFGSFDTGSLKLRVEWEQLNVNYTQNSNDVDVLFEYRIGAGWVNLATVTITGTGTGYTWTGGLYNTLDLTVAETRALQFRFAYEFNNVPNNSDIITLQSDFSFNLAGIINDTGYVPGYIPIDTSTWQVSQFETDSAGNVDWNATSGPIPH